MMGFFHHLLFPRESNNHRPKLLQYQGLLTIIALLLLGQFALTFASKHTDVLGSVSDISITDLLTKTNEVRAQNGLSALSLNSELNSAANAKGADMFAHNYWAHNSPEGLTPWVFIKGANYNYLYAGENLARGFDSAGAVMDAWMASPGHRENILSSHYNDIGFAVLSGNLTGEDTILVVEEFGSQNTSVADTTSVAVPTPTTLPRIAGAQITTAPTVIASAPAAVTHPIVLTPTLAVSHTTLVAGTGIVPLTNKRSLTLPIAIAVVGLLLFVLLADLAIIERKKIFRAVSHNLDHIIYLTLLLIILLIVGKGITL